MTSHLSFAMPCGWAPAILLPGNVETYSTQAGSVNKILMLADPRTDLLSCLQFTKNTSIENQSHLTLKGIRSSWNHDKWISLVKTSWFSGCNSNILMCSVVYIIVSVLTAHSQAQHITYNYLYTDFIKERHNRSYGEAFCKELFI